MSTLFYQAEPQIQYLYQLVRSIADGSLGLPKFQRPFVWTTDQRLDLFRSILAGTPIGSVMLWRTNREDVRCYSRIGPYELTAAKGSLRVYIIDGHQRLATCFAALHVPPEGTPPPDEVAYYDLEQEDFLFATGAEPPKPAWLPLRLILEFPLLLQFQRGLAALPAGNALIKRCDPVVTAFGQYKLPVTTVVTNSIDEVTRTFQRINSRGTVMSEVHMISALTWSEGFDLNERIAFWKEKWLAPLGWGDLDDTAILYVCKAALGFGVYDGDVDGVSAKLRQDPDALDAAGSALTDAVAFLRRCCGIRSPAVLPYPSHIVPLAEAFRRKPGRADGVDRDALVRWFWLMAYSGTSAGLPKVLKTLEHLAGDTTEPPPLPIHLGRELPPLPKRFDFRTARCRALSIRLAVRAGADSEVVLAEHGAGAMQHLILDWHSAEKEDFGSPANRIFARREEAAGMREGIKQACVEYAKPRSDLSPASAATLDRHCVSGPAALAFVEAVTSKDYPAFIDLRRQALQDMESEFLRGIDLLRP
jgi:hypothetical protein